jgi:hypothetical protein
MSNIISFFNNFLSKNDINIRKIKKVNFIKILINFMNPIIGFLHKKYKYRIFQHRYLFENE